MVFLKKLKYLILSLIEKNIYKQHLFTHIQQLINDQ